MTPENDGPQPPRSLGVHGRALWNKVVSQYELNDAGGQEILCQACAALDRAESLAELIDHQGEVVKSKTGTIRSHPAIRDEIACRALVARMLDRLGINLEPLRAGVGRPGTFVGVTRVE
jgi:hypothetical protein